MERQNLSFLYLDALTDIENNLRDQISLEIVLFFECHMIAFRIEVEEWELLWLRQYLNHTILQWNLMLNEWVTNGLKVSVWVLESFSIDELEGILPRPFKRFSAPEVDVIMRGYNGKAMICEILFDFLIWSTILIGSILVALLYL